MLSKHLQILLLSFAALLKMSFGEIYMMCEREGEIAFTYDQGPSQYTGKLLVTLAKHKVKATFHISPDYLDNPVILAYLRKAAMDGHLIGIFVKEEVGADNVKDYLNKASATIQRYTNYKPQFLRFPSPGPSEEVLKTVTGLGYIVTTYNLDSQDYNAVNVPVDGNESVFNVYKDILDQILPPAKGSFIAIQRDIVQASVEQSDQIIQYALDKGYKAVRLDQCIRKPQKDAVGGGADGDDKDKKKGAPKKETDSKDTVNPSNPSIPEIDDPKFRKLESTTSSSAKDPAQPESILFTLILTTIILFLK